MHVHMSLLHSAGDAAVAAHVRRAIARHQSRSMSTTESARFRAELRGIDGYVTLQDVGTDGQAEVAQIVRRDALSADLPAVRLSRVPVPRRGGQHVYAKPVDLVGGSRILGVHMPSGVEGARGFRADNDGQVAAYRDAIAGLRRYIAEHPQVDEIHGDWNLHARLDWVAPYFAQHFPDFVIVAPRTPTRGARVIDWALIRKGRGRHTAVTEPNPVSDHETVIVTRQEAAVSRTPKTEAFILAARRRGVEVLAHDQWGSRHRDLYIKRLTTHPHALLPAKPVDTVWNHITVTHDDGVLLGEFKADCREVERIGFERFGSGVSYNILVDANAPKPRIAIGQFLEAKGTHTVNDKGTAGYSFNQNKVAVAIAWVGMPGDKLNASAVEAFVQSQAALMEVGALTDHYDNVPHSLVAFKDCPTNQLRDRLSTIKRDALVALRGAPALQPTPRWDDTFEALRLAQGKLEQIAAAAPGSGAARDALAILEHLKTDLPIARARSTKF